MREREREKERKTFQYNIHATIQFHSTIRFKSASAAVGLNRFELSRRIEFKEYFPQHNVEGFLFSWLWPCLSSLLNFLFLDPPGKTDARFKKEF